MTPPTPKRCECPDESTAQMTWTRFKHEESCPLAAEKCLCGTGVRCPVCGIAGPPDNGFIIGPSPTKKCECFEFWKHGNCEHIPAPTESVENMRENVERVLEKGREAMEELGEFYKRYDSESVEEGWEAIIWSVRRPSNTTRSGYEVVYDPEVLIEQIRQLLQERSKEGGK